MIRPANHTGLRAHVDHVHSRARPGTLAETLGPLLRSQSHESVLYTLGALMNMVTVRRPRILRHPAARQCPLRVPSASALCQCPLRVPSASALCQCPLPVPSASALRQCPLPVPSASALCRPYRRACVCVCQLPGCVEPLRAQAVPLRLEQLISAAEASAARGEASLEEQHIEMFAKRCLTGFAEALTVREMQTLSAAAAFGGAEGGGHADNGTFGRFARALHYAVRLKRRRLASVRKEQDASTVIQCSFRKREAQKMAVRASLRVPRAACRVRVPHAWAVRVCLCCAYVLCACVL